MAKKWLWLTSVALLYITAIILGSFFDLQISQALCDLEFGEYYSSNAFGVVFEVVGELPVYILAGVCFVILFLAINPKKKAWDVVAKTVLTILSIGAFFLVWFKGYTYIMRHIRGGEFNLQTHMLGLFVLFGAVLSYLTYFFMKKLKPQTIKKLMTFAILSLAVIALSNAITQGIKPIIDRTRFRAMKFVGDTEFSNFSQWYQINKNTFDIGGIGSDAFKSFPSGHTTSAASLICLLFLFPLFPGLNSKKNKLIVYPIIILWTALVAISRIVVGAHFFTDVVFGSLFTVLSFGMVYFIYKIIVRKKFNK